MGTDTIGQIFWGAGTGGDGSRRSIAHFHGELSRFPGFLRPAESS